jgi:tetratricopeptide (TPR) repeat protein
LFLQNNQPQLALNILHRIDSRYNQDEMYLSLLASAYQQNNEDLHSLQIYQKLIVINPQKAEYWLGFAIAQEKQGNKVQALKGYQQALDKKTLKKSIVSYIKQRVSSLKRL